MIPLDNGGAIRLTTARFTTPNGREIQGKGLEPDLDVSALKLAKLGHGEGRHEADLPGALKNPDEPDAAAGKPPANAPAGATATPPPPEAPSVATGEIGSASDEQLTQAIDVLRGLSLIGRRASG
jgi:carboxyl-terminal processing protease